MLAFSGTDDLFDALCRSLSVQTGPFLPLGIDVLHIDDKKKIV
jgi:hypothetical protein